MLEEFRRRIVGRLLLEKVSLRGALARRGTLHMQMSVIGHMLQTYLCIAGKHPSKLPVLIERQAGPASVQPCNPPHSSAAPLTAFPHRLFSFLAPESPEKILHLPSLTPRLDRATNPRGVEIDSRGPGWRRGR